MKNSILFVFLITLLLPGIANASTLSTTDNLFENTYSNNLIDMAQTQIDNVSNKKYAIIQVNNDYYFISAKKEDVTVKGYIITMNNTKIIKAIRNQSNYNYFYEYSTVNEGTTTIYVNNIIISNIDTSKSISSKRFEDYLSNKNTIFLLIFILGLVFAIFLTKERKY